MEIKKCYICEKPKANLNCGLCNSALCKKCAQFLEEGTFSFYKKIPANLTHTTYCNPCYSQKIVSEIEIYNQLLERAKDITVFYKDQGKETRRMPRGSEIFEVQDCQDREEAILRLAFFAVQGHYTTLVDVNLEQQKIRQGSYQYSLWHATAVPVQLEVQKSK